MGDSIVSCFCNSCSRVTDHAVVWADSTDVELPDGSASGTRVQVLRCCGCRECTLQQEQWYFSGIPDPDEEATQTIGEAIYEPARLWRRAPDWLKEIEDRDPDLKGILDEVYLATNDKQVRLLSMGVRSTLDYVMTKILGEDGSFNYKMKKMVENGHLTERQKDNLSVVIDAGSASTHRNFRPPKQLLEEMVILMESVVRDHYITGPMLNTAKMLIPPRP